MIAADVMATDVITARASQTVQEVAGLLLTHNISAVPVLSDRGELVGIVSEGDLMRRAEAGTEHPRSWWLAALSNPETLAQTYAKEHARQISDVMTREVITVEPDTPLSEIANLMESKGIKRVVVLENGKVSGIVSRANLLRALASAKAKSAMVNPDDAAIRDDILRRIGAEAWKPERLNVIVHDGTVELWGFADSPSQKKAARIAAEATPGVRAVNDNIVLRSSEATGASPEQGGR
jgi:CBS domain-containing protein